MDLDEEKFLADLERECLVHEVNNYITLFHRTGDARFFWRAFLVLHEAGEPIPPDFMTQIVKWAGRLLGADSPGQIASALGLAGDRKAHAGKKTAAAYQSRWRLASQVQIVRGNRPMTLNEAFCIVARNSGKSVPWVKKVYHEMFPSDKARRARTAKAGAAVSCLADAIDTWR